VRRPRRTMMVKKTADMIDRVITLVAKERVCMATCLVGDQILVHNNWSIANINDMRRKMELGDVEYKKQKAREKEPLDFDAMYKGSLHVSHEGWVGFPSTGFKNAMRKIAATKNYQLNGEQVKLGIFVMYDGIDKVTNQGLVRIYDAPKTKVERFDAPVRIGGMNKVPYIAARGRHRSGWTCTLRLRFDAKRIRPEDVLEILRDAGELCGIGAGRPGSEKSCGMGWGTFTLADKAELVRI
jgi:hypothetical protein